MSADGVATEIDWAKAAPAEELLARYVDAERLVTRWENVSRSDDRVSSLPRDPRELATRHRDHLRAEVLRRMRREGEPS